MAAANFGGLVADAIVPPTARQHLWNPLWTPHAKFHNGQTMLMGVIGGALSLAILFASHPLTLPLFLIAAAVAGGYFVAMAFAPMFPGTDWVDPEFAATTGRPLGLAPQQLVTYLLCGLMIVAVHSPILLDGGRMLPLWVIHPTNRRSRSARTEVIPPDTSRPSRTMLTLTARAARESAQQSGK